MWVVSEGLKIQINVKFWILIEILLQTRIYNGDTAQKHEFPSMLALIALSINRVFCGGVIISEWWSLTGAHCFNEELYKDLKNIAALAGEHDLTVDNETQFTEMYEIQKVIAHEKYSKSNYMQDFDIALMKMARPIQFNRAVGPACLPWNFPEE